MPSQEELIENRAKLENQLDQLQATLQIAAVEYHLELKCKCAVLWHQLAKNYYHCLAYVTHLDDRIKLFKNEIYCGEQIIKLGIQCGGNTLGNHLNILRLLFQLYNEDLERRKSWFERIKVHLNSYHDDINSSVQSPTEMDHNKIIELLSYRLLVAGNRQAIIARKIIDYYRNIDESHRNDRSIKKLFQDAQRVLQNVTHQNYRLPSETTEKSNLKRNYPTNTVSATTHKKQKQEVEPTSRPHVTNRPMYISMIPARVISQLPSIIYSISNTLLYVSSSPSPPTPRAMAPHVTMGKGAFQKYKPPKEQETIQSQQSMHGSGTAMPYSKRTGHQIFFSSNLSLALSRSVPVEITSLLTFDK